MKRAAGGRRGQAVLLSWDIVVVVLVVLAVLAAWAQRAPTVNAAALPLAGAQEVVPLTAREPAPPRAADLGADADYVPMVTAAPVYPADAERQRIEGHCTVEYTIAATGAVRSVRARRCVPAGVFEKAAVNAARQFKYRPRIRAGAPVEVTGVRNEFQFALRQ